MERTEVIVIGAGIIGLAVARKLAVMGRDVLILEGAQAFGTGNSARNSEVIHAGIYYPKDSMKAQLCAPGREALYRYCESRGIPHRRCGKLIVDNIGGSRQELESIMEAGIANGVSDLELWDSSRLARLGFGLSASAAIWSPSTGIVDSHQLMLALLGEAEAAGASLVLNSPVVSGTADRDGIALSVGGAEPVQISANTVINCAGMSAMTVAAAIEGLPVDTIPKLEMAKGSYFSYQAQVPFDRLIYPLPAPGGLGIHLTLDIAGQARFGPDVEWVNGENYEVNESRRAAFEAAVASYWPAIDGSKLLPAYAGIRAKVRPEGKPYHDFVFSGPSDHGVEGLINLYGIESPGLTSCLAVADHVAAMIYGIFANSDSSAASRA